MKLPFSEHELVLACRTLFGPGIQLSPDFLDGLQTGGVKAAFREQVKQNHPDLFAAQGAHIQNQRTESFRALLKAVSLLQEFLGHRDKTSAPATAARPEPRRTDPEPTPEARPAAGDFYRGPLPSRSLEFGSYLYYRGTISYRTLLAALAWQRRQRPTIGDLARHWQWLNAAEILRICRERNVYGRFGEKAIQLGLLRPDQVQTLLVCQRAQQRKIGQYFIASGLLSPVRVETLVQEMHRHNLRFSPPATDCFNRTPTTG